MENICAHKVFVKIPQPRKTYPFHPTPYISTMARMKNASDAQQERRVRTRGGGTTGQASSSRGRGRGTRGASTSLGQNRGKQPASTLEFEYTKGKSITFPHNEGLEKFLRMQHRKIIEPRFLDKDYASSKGYGVAHQALVQSNCYHFFSRSVSKYTPMLVLAFYANLEQLKEDVCQDEDIFDLNTNVDGKEIFLNDANIREFTMMNATSEVDEEIPDDVLTQFYRDMNVNPDTRQIKNIIPEFRYLHYVIITIVKPRNTSRTTITRPDAKLMYHMIHNNKINWSKVIRTHMWACAKGKKPLPYASLIMAMLDEYEVVVPRGILHKARSTWRVDDLTFHLGAAKTLKGTSGPATTVRELGLEVREVKTLLNKICRRQERIMNKIGVDFSESSDEEGEGEDEGRDDDSETEREGENDDNNDD